MSMPAPADQTPLTHKRQLVSWLETGSKSPECWRVGMEHEKFLFDRKTLRPLSYDGEKGIAVLLDELQAFHWKPVEENGKVIGLSRDGTSISLEPGGQLEFSGSPLASLHDVAAEFHHHLDEMGSVGRVLEFGSLGMGFQPKWALQDMPWMPKERYALMRAYMPSVGDHGLDMMARTCTVQASFDFASEADMAKKLRTSLALQPVVATLFACSPFAEGKPSGYFSTRNRVWLDTDTERADPLGFAFSSHFGFEAYTDWALTLPMYFVYRNGHHIDAQGATFLNFMQGRLPALPGEIPMLSDWITHLGTLFPQVRLRRTLEMRGADMGNADMALALPALWTGLLYDSVALDEASQLVAEWSDIDRATMFENGPRMGIRDELRPGRTLRRICADLLRIAQRGLRRRQIEGYSGADESIYLQPLHAIIDYGVTHAEDLLRRYFDEWSCDIDRAFQHCRIT